MKVLFPVAGIETPPGALRTVIRRALLASTIVILSSGARDPGPLPHGAYGDRPSGPVVGGDEVSVPTIRWRADGDAAASGSSGCRGPIADCRLDAHGSGTTASLTGTLDAQSLRGGLIEVRADLGTTPVEELGGRRSGSVATLYLSVRRPAPWTGGFHDFMILDRVGRVPGVLIGRVARDATSVVVGITVTGATETVVRSMTVRRLEPVDRPPSPEAGRYLEAAIKLLKEHHRNSAFVDWPRAEADAYDQIRGADVPSQTYPAIRGVLGELGDRHSSLVPAPAAATRVRSPVVSSDVPVRPQELPASTLSRGRFGVVRLPGLDTLGRDGPAEGRRYAAALRASLIRMDLPGLCGWIVDLRRDVGGNMWPMLNGLDPLLGDAPFGYFRAPSGSERAWTRTAAGVAAADASGSRKGPGFGLHGSGLPIAVLLGPGTSSAGEMVALALTGRPEVRTFGGPTAGYLSGNAPYALADGAYLIVSEVVAVDRRRVSRGDRVEPDDPTDVESAQGAAERWLSRDCGTGGKPIGGEGADASGPSGPVVRR